MINVKTFVLGAIGTNTYLIQDENTKELAVIDPACESFELNAKIREWGGNLRYILLTHGHFDHIGGVSSLLKEFSPQVVIGEDETKLLNTPTLNLSAFHGLNIEKIDVHKALYDGEVFKLGDTQVKYISTPGHTVGSGCYIIDDCIFSGDTLFCQSIGRTDFPTSSGRDMMLSLMRLNDLEGDYTVYPGHDVSTTLSDERKYNPYMR
ncbi:MAG: MBL fold metallo-hydrolase [Ruminococcus sp.]|nr:MBL fold metallo-hydrolase [Ruminococcus sp.]